MACAGGDRALTTRECGAIPANRPIAGRGCQSAPPQNTATVDFASPIWFSTSYATVPGFNNAFSYALNTPGWTNVFSYALNTPGWTNAFSYALQTPGWDRAFRFGANQYPVQDFWLCRVARRADGKFQTETVRRVLEANVDPWAGECRMPARI